MLTMNKIICQKISNKSQFKQKLNKFIVNNIDPNIGINHMLAFAKRNRVMVSTDLEQYRENSSPGENQAGYLVQIDELFSNYFYI